MKAGVKVVLYYMIARQMRVRRGTTTTTTTTKLKMGVLPLQIELGRWKDVPLEYRVCRVCESNELEDEYHHVLFCDALVVTRTHLFGELEDVNYDNKESLLKSIFKRENLKTAGRFIEAMYMERRELLYKSKVVEWSED